MAGEVIFKFVASATAEFKFKEMKIRVGTLKQITVQVLKFMSCETTVN